jgi:glycosyltransferase involved in cell wall biosynthesis
MATTKIRVCHVQCLSMVAGAQRTMLQIFDVIDRDRYELSVICQNSGPLVDELNARQIPVHFAPSLVRPVHPYHDWKAIGQLRTLFEQIKPDIVHTHSSKPGIVGRRAAFRSRVPHIVHHVQGYAFHEFTSYPKRLVFETLEALAARWSSRIIFVSEEERQYSIQKGWISQEKTVRIPNVVDRSGRTPMTASQRAEIRLQHGLLPEEIGIVMIGRIDFQKQPEIIVPLASQLKASGCAGPWKLLVAGDGPLMPSLQHQIERAGLGDIVKLLGWIKEPDRLLQACDIMLLPSLWEGLPLVLIEAFGAGLPIVASRVKGNRELVMDDVGFLCDARNPSAYVQPLKALIADRQLRSRLGAAGLARAPEFDLRRVMIRVEKLYDELIGPKLES